GGAARAPAADAAGRACSARAPPAAYPHARRAGPDLRVRHRLGGRRSGRAPAGAGPPMTGPELAVVVASVNGMPYLADCLTALDRHCPEAELIVADWTDSATRAVVRDRWPRVRLLSFDEPMAVPELRAAGIAEASASHVAVI